MTEAHQTFRDLIADNKRKSVILIVLFCLSLAVLSVILTLGVMAYVAPALFEGEGPLAPGLPEGRNVQHRQSQVKQPTEGPEINWPAAIMMGITGGAVALASSYLGFFSGDEMIMTVHRGRPV